MMEKLSGPPTEYVTSRNALYWVSLRANLLMMGERGALMSLAMPGGKPELYPAALKAAGVNDDSMGKVQKVLDHFTADAKAALAVAKDPAATPTIRQEAQSKVLVLADSARKEIRGLLTAEQNIDLDWAILQIGLPPGQRGGNIVTMSALSGAVKAPVDGTYVLQTSDSKGAPATHATVTLKKGTPLSFRMTDKGLKGIAGEKEFDVPGTPAPVAAWNYEREK